MKIALVFGVLGQDGAYLSQFLLEAGYRVYGVYRRTSLSNTSRLKRLGIAKHSNLHLIEGDVSDPFSVNHVFSAVPWSGARVKEVYNLAAQSHVQTSFFQPNYTFDVNTKGCLNILEAIKNGDRSIRYYFAGTSEQFGNSCDSDSFQRETTPMIPCSPYAISKLAAYHLVKNYREAYNLHSSTGILFNHESPLRGDEFVTRKITKYLAKLKVRRDSIYALDDITKNYESGLNKLRLGNIDSYRDFGFSGDYVRAMWLMLQQDSPDDYVIATGVATQIKEFLLLAFGYININDYSKYIQVDESLKRPSELHFLRGCSDKARKILGWQPDFDVKKLVAHMIDGDIEHERLSRPQIQTLEEQCLPER